MHRLVWRGASRTVALLLAAWHARGAAASPSGSEGDAGGRALGLWGAGRRAGDGDLRAALIALQARPGRVACGVLAAARAEERARHRLRAAAKHRCSNLAKLDLACVGVGAYKPADGEVRVWVWVWVWVRVRARARVGQAVQSAPLALHVPVNDVAHAPLVPFLLLAADLLVQAAPLVDKPEDQAILLVQGLKKRGIQLLVRVGFGLGFGFGLAFSFAHLVS